jgi:mannose-6-phosphate isomerase
MKTIARMKNAVQAYQWGSRTFIPELLGQKTPSDQPMAELWMGAHPKAPSRVEVNGRWVSLLDVIEEHPREVLGEDVVQRFGRRLPYLFKVLAADQPLSIQAHPNLEQAREGFARENRLGIPLDDPQRNYRDADHKPELICALTDFWALKGFRRVDAILDGLRPLHRPELLPELGLLRRQPDEDGLRRFFRKLMTLDSDRRSRVVAAAVDQARPRAEEDPACRWVLELDRAYPGDVGVLAPLMMNLVRLSPGEAMFLGAGQLHAYLSGSGIELMANSDNVLRGGLTPKHIDVPELLRVLNFTTGAPRILHPRDTGDGEAVYRQPADEFSLSVITLQADRPVQRQGRGVEILLCMRAEALITDDRGGRVSLSGGDSVLVPAAVRRYTLQGEGVLYSAHVPRSGENT